MRIKKKWRCVVTLVSLWAGAASLAATPRVAVWDPQMLTKEGRFKIDLKLHDQAAQWLQAAGMPVSRVTAQQIADPATFSAGKFDVLMMAGDSVPRLDIKAMQQFADDGGVLVCLGSNIPFVVAIEPEKDGKNWTMSPNQPAFAWQTGDILNYFGGKYIYNPGMHDRGVNHTPTELLKKYVPAAPAITNKILPSRFVPPYDDAANNTHGEYYALLRSVRADDRDTTPQMWVMKNGKRLAIISSSTIFTSNSDPALWPCSEKTVVAFAQMAKDLRDGITQLKPEEKLAFSETTGPQAPLTGRIPSGKAVQGIDPEQAKSLVRWGKFDASCLEFGPELAPGKTAEIAAGSSMKTMPRGMEPGTTLRLAFSALPSGQHFLRIRGAFLATGGGLSVRYGDTLVWNEKLNYSDAGGPGNINASDLKDVPAEFTRVIYLPPSPATTLTLGNTGDKPVYFDAIQIEQHVGPNPEMVIGFNGTTRSFPTLAKEWGAARAGVSFSMVGPPEDSKRWDKFDKEMEKLMALGCPIHFLFEGTPKWAAISAERWNAEVARPREARPSAVPPDPAKYAEMTDRMVLKYGKQIQAYEIWNEANSQKYYKGTYAEYSQLAKMMIATIRKHQPDARIMCTGMAGFTPALFKAMEDADVLKDINWVGNHVYAGKGSGWDVAYGVGQGDTMAAGYDIDFNLNEQGYVFKNAQWFTSPPIYTPYLQMELTDIAMARLLANGASKSIVFNAKNVGDEFDYVLNDGTPRPAYAVVRDYFALNNGRRLDVSMTRPDGKPLQGVYMAASQHTDGSISLIVNPAEVIGMQPPAPYIVPNSDEKFSGWGAFAGKPKFDAGKVILDPGKGQSYIGFGAAVSINLDRLVTLEVSVLECEKAFNLTMQIGGKQVELLKNKGAGIYKINLRELLGPGRKEGEMTFRCFGHTVLAHMRFLDTDGKQAAVGEPEAGPSPAPIPVLLRIPLEKAGARRGSVRVGSETRPLPIAIRQDREQTWAEMTLDVTGRSIVTIGK